MSKAIYYDGEISQSQHVTIAITETHLRIQQSNRIETIQNWAYEEITIIGNPKDGVPIRLTHPDTSSARLLIEDAALWETIYAHLRPHQRGWHLPTTPLSLMAMLAGAVIMVIAFFALSPSAPAWLAPLISHEVRTKLSEEVVDALHTQYPVCNQPEGLKALRQLYQRLAKNQRLQTIPNVTVIHHPMANAITLPDNRIILFDGLIQASQNSNEVAGVLAHELGHVMYNHPVQALAKSIGTRIISFLVFGGSSSSVSATGLLNSYIDGTYRHSMEHDADIAALEILSQAGIKQQGLVSFFHQLEEKHGNDEGILGYFSTHPPTQDRITTINALITDTASGDNALSDDAWKDLQHICDGQISAK